jgi:hypothetical protein
MAGTSQLWQHCTNTSVGHGAHHAVAVEGHDAGQGVWHATCCGCLLQAESHHTAHLSPGAELTLLASHCHGLVLGLKHT